MRTKEELKALQGLDLETKVMLTKDRIRQWVQEYSTDGVYVSFSGGKDSTTLLQLVREMYPEVEAVYVDTGLEYPEIREFVKTFENVTWLKPEMNFKQVILKYGYPFISKEVSQCVEDAKRWYANPTEKKIARVKKLEGTYSESYINDYSRYHFLTQTPFKISAKCCDVMKKRPVKHYEKTTGKHAITGQMADESKLRTQQWVKNGCNGFNMARPMSNPMSFWTEQDVLAYINQNNIKIASVYGEVVEDWSDEQCDGQISYGINRVKYKTTGCQRTGCMFCGYGCHLEKNPNRFEKLKSTHPAQYNYIMKPVENGGLGFKEVIDWINEHNPSDRTKIKY